MVQLSIAHLSERGHEASQVVLLGSPENRMILVKPLAKERHHGLEIEPSHRGRGVPRRTRALRSRLEFSFSHATFQKFIVEGRHPAPFHTVPGGDRVATGQAAGDQRRIDGASTRGRHHRQDTRTLRAWSPSQELRSGGILPYRSMGGLGLARLKAGGISNHSGGNGSLPSSRSVRALNADLGGSSVAFGFMLDVPSGGHVSAPLPRLSTWG